jgi:hypothetical protein
MVEMFTATRRKKPDSPTPETAFKSQIQQCVHCAAWRLWNVFVLFICVVVAIFDNFGVFVPSCHTGRNYEQSDYVKKNVGFLGTLLYLAMFIGYRLMYRT